MKFLSYQLAYFSYSKGNEARQISISTDLSALYFLQSRQHLEIDEQDKAEQLFQKVLELALCSEDAKKQMEGLNKI